MVDDNTNPSPTRIPRPADGREGPRKLVLGVIVFGVVLAVVMWTSAPPLPDDELELPQEPAASDLVPSEDAENREDAIKLPPQESQLAAKTETRVSIETMADLQTGWLKITRQSSAGKTSSAVAQYEAENEFEIQTENIDGFVLDLSQLPVNSTRRFILHIDGQDILAFPQTRGPVEFGRTAEGTWQKQ